MKTREIQTSKAKILVVDLPEGAKSISLTKLENKNVLWYQMPIIIGSPTFDLRFECRDGNWQILGLLDSLTEEQMGSVEDSVWSKFWECNIHQDYEFQAKEPIFKFYRASESFSSLLSSAGITRENEYGEEPNFGDYNKFPLPIEFNPVDEIRELAKRDHRISELWNAAEENTFRNPLILINTL